MKRGLLLLASLLLAGSTSQLVGQPPPPKPTVTLKVEKFVGKVERVNPKQNTVTVRLEKELRVVNCAKDCRVFNKEGRLGKLADLPRGTEVEVSTVEVNGVETAQRITPVEALDKDTRLSKGEKK
jgi:hypothetical protein